MTKSISEKIKAILKLHNKNTNDYANALDINIQSLRNKYYRESFTVNDLLTLSDVCEGKIAFIDKDGSIIYLN